MICLVQEHITNLFFSYLQALDCACDLAQLHPSNRILVVLEHPIQSTVAQRVVQRIRRILVRCFLYFISAPFDGTIMGHFWMHKQQQKNMLHSPLQERNEKGWTSHSPISIVIIS